MVIDKEVIEFEFCIGVMVWWRVVCVVFFCRVFLVVLGDLEYIDFLGEMW